MKDVLLVGLIVAGLSSLASLPGPVSAYRLGIAQAPLTNPDACEAMFEACETGDWEAMADSAEEKHGERIGYRWNVNSKGR